MNRNRPSGSKKALAAESALVGLLVGYGSFSGYRFVLLLLLASYSLWIRQLSWSDMGLRRPPGVWGTLLGALVGALLILVLLRTVIVPAAVRLAGVPLDLSVLGEPGDAQALWIWLGRAWTLAAFGEEMVFRGYLIHRLVDLVGDTTFGRTTALLLSSVLFGLAHSYQGLAGMIVTGATGGILALFYFANRRNLWAVIVCHGIVDTVALTLMYFDRGSWLFLLG